MQSIVSNPAGQQSQGMHGSYNAVDYVPTASDPYYYAPEDGTVTLVDNTDDDSCGKRLRIKGATGEHGFCHNDTIYVKVGQNVKRGHKLAKMGYTGYTQDAQGRDNTPGGTHVHWILNINGVWVYPPSKVNQSFVKLGTEGADDMTNKGDVINLFVHLLGREPDAKALKTWVGKPWGEVFKGIVHSPEYINRRARIQSALKGGSVQALKDKIINFVKGA